jgi:hypothetical protein
VNASCALQTCIRLDPRGIRNHEAVIRFGGEAPRRRAHSGNGIEATSVFGSPQPRIFLDTPYP